MGTYYSYMLRVGYEVSEEDITLPFLKKDPGEFRTEPATEHMEDRFDPKTGKKIDPIRITDVPAKNIWIRKPSQTLHIGTEIIEYDAYDPNNLADVFAKQLNCFVEWVGSDGNNKYNFFIHDCGKIDRDEGRISVSNREMNYFDVVNMQHKLQDLGTKMKELGLKVPSLKVFIAESIG